MAAREPAIYIQGDATDTLYLNPVPTPETSPIPPGDGEDPFGVIYVSSGDVLSPNVGHPYYRKPSDGQTFDLLQSAALGTATFITVTAEPTLPQSRRLAVTSDLSLTDGGALGPITIGLSAANVAAIAKTALFNTATFITVVNEPGLALSRRLAAGTRIAIADAGAQSTITVSVDAATDTLLSDLSTAPFLFPTNEALAFPQSRQVIAGANITITDNGAGGTFVISAPNAVTILGPVPHVMSMNFTDGVIGIPNAFDLIWFLYKVGRMVMATLSSGTWPSPSLLPGSINTAPGSEFPLAYRPVVDVVLPANCRQGAGSVPSMTTHEFTTGGTMNMNFFGTQVWPNFIGQIPALSVAGGDGQTFMWQGS